MQTTSISIYNALHVYKYIYSFTLHLIHIWYLADYLSGKVIEKEIDGKLEDQSSNLQDQLLKSLFAGIN